MIRRHPISRVVLGAMDACRSNCRGVCLAEVMISLTAGAIVMAASLETFNVLHAETVRQQRSLAQQQDLRIGLEVFEQEVRLASPDSIATATSGEFQFLANVNAQATLTTAAVLPGQTFVAVQDGTGWTEGKRVMLCGLHGCEEHRLSRAGQRLQLTLAEPVEMAFPAGASVEVRNRVAYYQKPDGKGMVRLMRMVDGGASVLIGELDDLRLSYWTKGGRATSLSSDVNRVVIEITPHHSTKRLVGEVSLRS